MAAATRALRSSAAGRVSTSAGSRRRWVVGPGCGEEHLELGDGLFDEHRRAVDGVQTVCGSRGEEGRLGGVRDVEGDPTGGEGIVPDRVGGRLGGEGGDDDRRRFDPGQVRPPRRSDRSARPGRGPGVHGPGCERGSRHVRSRDRGRPRAPRRPWLRHRGSSPDRLPHHCSRQGSASMCGVDGAHDAACTSVFATCT
jgi:hypothetical protein